MRAIHVSRKTLIISAILIVAVIAALFIWSPWRASPQTPSITPPFSALLPKDTTIEKLGGWKKLASPDGTTAYVYSDTIDGTSISVSQQSLPDSLKDSDGTKLADMAKSFNATKTMTARAAKVYIGTSASGPQSVIFSENNILVLIKSTAVIKDASWMSYINSLT